MSSPCNPLLWKSALVLAGSLLVTGCHIKHPPAESPCTDGTWAGGRIDPDAAVHVASDGSDASDGSADSPLASLAAALAQAEDTGPKAIFVGPGTFPAGLHLASGTDDDLLIAGCSMEETTLEPADATVSDSIVSIKGASGVSLASLSTQGGSRAVLIEGTADVGLDTVTINASTRVGLVVYGAATVDLSEVYIDGTVADPDAAGSVGYGISVQGADASLRADISMEGGGIVGSSSVGFLADTAELSLTEVEVSGTLADVSTGVSLLGRGVQVQNFSSLEMSNCNIHDNADAAVFSISSASLTIADSTLSGTAASAIPDASDTTGDGLVARRGDDDASFPVSYFTVDAQRNTIDGNQRAGAVLEDVTVAALSGNTGSNAYGAGGLAFVVQGSTDATAASDTVTTPATSLALNTQAVVPDTGAD